MYPKPQENNEKSAFSNQKQYFANIYGLLKIKMQNICISVMEQKSEMKVKN